MNQAQRKILRKKRRKIYIWKFERMHPSLQVLSILLGGVAFVGWTMIGVWFLYFLMY